MNSSAARLWIALGIAAGVVVVFLISTGHRDAGPHQTDRPAEPAKPQPTRPSEANGGRVEGAALESATGSAIPPLIADFLKDFRANASPEQAARLLRALRARIRELPDEEAAAAIIAFLKSGENASLGLPFVVGADGMMDLVPTMRLALLDLLPSVDPVAALEMARSIMERRTSPDEYAIALRNLAWNDLDGDLRGELAGWFIDLLESHWRNQPTAGFLESFDIAVEVGGAEIFSRLVSLTENASDSDISPAAFMSLDRMVLRDHSLLTAALAADPQWMSFAPQQRASLLSRLDITRPTEREVFSRYLSSSSHGAGELEYFAKVFPNRNYLYGHRLVTADDATPTINEVAAADAQVADALAALETSASAEAAETIRKIRDRLQKLSPAK